ncbi:MAG: twin-arginine translocase TatA/TatE family subunit [Gammaproteobacteria bacterium]|jgi:sec-independent protein translocase protein TatA
MGFGIKELVVILIIVILVFGTKKIRNIGGDVGGWIRDFRKAMKEEPAAESEVSENSAGRIIEGETQPKKEHV